MKPFQKLRKKNKVSMMSLLEKLVEQMHEKKLGKVAWDKKSVE